MILIVQGHLPFEESDRKRLYEEWGRGVPTIFVHPNPSGWSFGALGGFSKKLNREIHSVGLSRLRLPSLIPGSRFRLISQWNRWLSMRYLLRWLRKNSSEHLVLTCQYPVLLPTFRGLPADLTVYDVVDDYISGLDGRGASRRVRRAHERFVHSSDVVWTLSDTLARQVRNLGVQPKMTRLGVDWDEFSAAGQKNVAPEISQINYPRIGLVGRLNDRIDWSLILELCETHPEWNLVFVGPIYGGKGKTDQTHKVLLEETKPDNLHYLPPVRPEELPQYLVGLNVGLIPYRPAGAVLSINPLKVYQFLATGVPVVATPIPSLQKFKDVVRICSTASEFSSGISDALQEPDDEMSRQERKERVREFGWTNVAEYHLKLLQDELHEPISIQIDP